MVILEEYNQFGATERTAGALRNILDYHGVVAPHTGEPFTEALLMGIGGGLGAEYATWAFKGFDSTTPGKSRLYLRFYHVKNYVEKEEETAIYKIAARIGAQLKVKKTASRTKGFTNLVEHLKEGNPVITALSVWESLKLQREVKRRFKEHPNLYGPLLYDEFVHFLPYYSLPYGWFHSHLAIVYGVDEAANQAYIADWSSKPLTVTLDELAEARGVVNRIKNTTVVVEPPTSIPKLEKAIRAGIRDCYQGLLEGYIGAVRVDAWKIMGSRMGSYKDKQRWSSLFSEPVRLFDALTRLHAQIDFLNSDGGALRSSYSDFLLEASDILRKPNLRDVAVQFADVGTLWDDLESLALPDDIPLLREARFAAVEWNNLFEVKGQSASKELEARAEKIKTIRSKVAQNFPLTGKELFSFFENLSQCLHEIYEHEKGALVALKAAVPI